MRAAVRSEPLGLVVGRGYETHLQPKTSLQFLDNDTIVATFVTREGNPTLSGRASSDTNLSLRLLAVFLDARTGKITAAPAWPTESRFAGIVATNHGEFVTQRGTTLTLYSSDAKELRKLSLPPIQEDFLWGWFAHASPTGKSVLFATPDLRRISETPWIWVDTGSLQVVRSWKETQSGWVGMSDDAIAMTACIVWFYHCEPHIAIRGLEADWKTIAPLEQRNQQYPTFINRDLLFVSGHPWKLLRTDGKAVCTEDAPFEGGTAITSVGGQRFVVPFFQSKGGIAPLDIGAHGELKTISVYDAPFHERSYRLEVKGPKIKELAQLVLSPDGSLLAILYDESVYLFQLPPPPSTPAPPPSKADDAAHRGGIGTRYPEKAGDPP